jgi:predicted Rossmann-fold nucleotide-binding protein
MSVITYKKLEKTANKVACFGGGSGKPGDPMYNKMREVGELLAKNKYIVVTGAGGGIMSAAAQGAKEDAGCRTIGLTHSGNKPNAYIVDYVDCHKLSKNISYSADYGIRMCGLLTCDHFVFAAGGGNGTFLELIAVINFQEKRWKRAGVKKKIVILHPIHALTERINGWDWSMIQQLEDWGLFDTSMAINVVETPNQVLDYIRG